MNYTGESPGYTKLSDNARKTDELDRQRLTILESKYTTRTVK